MRTKNPFGYRSHGVKNFYYEEQSMTIRSIYSFLARPKQSGVKSIEEADSLIKNFCKHELGFESTSLIRCARRVQKNWKAFAEAAELTK